MKTFQYIASALTIASTNAFSPSSVEPVRSAVKESFDPLNMADPVAVLPKVSMATAAAVALNPLIAFAGVEIRLSLS